MITSIVSNDTRACLVIIYNYKQSTINFLCALQGVEPTRR